MSTGERSKTNMFSDFIRKVGQHGTVLSARINETLFCLPEKVPKQICLSDFIGKMGQHDAIMSTG